MSTAPPPTRPPALPFQPQNQRHTTTIELGTIKVTTTTTTTTTTTPAERRRQGKPSLTVSTTLLLGALPRQTTITTAIELCDASKRGEIFLAKAGSCEIGFETRVDGVPVLAAGAGAGIEMDGGDDMAGVGVLAGGCAVWGDVGVVLKGKHVDGDEAGVEGGRASFFLHHRDLATEMVKVVGGRVPVVEFEGMDVVLDFWSGRKKQGPGKNRKGKGVGRGKEVPVAVEKPESLAHGGHRYGLRREPRPTTKVREAWRDAAVEEDDRGEEEAPPRYVWSISEMANLLDVGLRKLLGVGKGPQGFRTSRSKPSPSLMDIAPGVWNLRYLESLETHARAIPAIASGIARLTNARSSLLREKVVRLGLSGRPAGNSIDHVNSREQVGEEIRGRLWSLCQTKIQVDPMVKTTTHTRTAATKEKLTYEAGRLPLARQGDVMDGVGGSQEYFDDHDGQLVLFEASSSVPRHLPGEFSGEMGSEVIYKQQIHPDMVCDPGQILGGDGTDALIDNPPWTTISTSHSDSWAEQGPHDHLLEDSAGNSSPIYYVGHRGLLVGGGENADICQEEHLLVTSCDRPFPMTSTNDGFQHDTHQYHHALGFPEDVITDEDMEEEDEAFIYTDGQGNCYTFEPYDTNAHDAGFPESVLHLASVHQASTEEGHRTWFHEC